MRREDLLNALESIGRQSDEAIDLAEAALLLAALDRPGADLGPYRSHLATLAADLADIAPGKADPLDARVTALRQVMADRHGYTGDRRTYDDPANASLMAVIDRRRGLPVALGILYLHAARAQGWRAAGVNFPGHFLIALEDDEDRIILDPFDQGAEVDTDRLESLIRTAMGPDAVLQPEFTNAMTNRGVLLRLQNNIKSRARDGGDHRRASAIVDSMLAIAPEISDLWREAAELRTELGELRAALAALDRYLLLSDDSERADALALRRQVATRIN